MNRIERRSKAIKSAVVTLAIAGLMSVFATPLPAQAAESVATVESFNSVGSSWTRALGTSTAQSDGDATEGASALALTYDISAGSAEIGRTQTPPVFKVGAYRALKLDIKGDGSYNTFYLRLQDATGEVLYYRVGNLNNTNWSTAVVDLQKGLAASSGGDANKRIDGAVSLYRLVVVRNGSEAAKGRILVDNLRTVGDGWTGATASPRYFAAGAQSTTLSVPVGTPGDFRLVVSDVFGHQRTFDSKATSTGTASLGWDGKTADGVAFEGTVSGVLSYDTTPNGSLVAPTTVGLPYLAGVATRTAAKASSSLVGVNSSLSTYEGLASAEADARLMEGAFTRYAREEFEWNRVEPRNGYFEWFKFDRAVAVAKARNVDVVGKLVYTADWASSAPAGTAAADVRYYPPKDINDWNDYVRQTVNRYKDSVKVWEVWNEPNIDKYWKPAPSAAGYATLLKSANSIIKAASPDSTVLVGGLANGLPEAYMNSMISNGAGNSFDGVAVHMYVNGAPEPSIIDSWMTGAKSYMARKLPGKSLWITEVGWTTCGSCTTKVSEEEQAQYLSRFMIEAANQGIKSVLWFNLRELGTSTSSIDNYGLVQKDGRLKPAYVALARFGAATVETAPAGAASPSPDGKTTVLNDMAQPSQFKPSSVGSGGSTTVSTSSGRVGGTAALAVNYNYSNSKATGGLLSTGVSVAGQPGALSIWAYGDNSNNPVFLKFVDAKGETFEAKIGNLGTKDWERLVFYFDGNNPNYTHSGGNNDAKVDFPIIIKQIHVYKSTSSGVTSGQFLLDDLSAHYDGIMRGAVFVGRGYVTQALYSLTARDVNLSVPSSTAYIYDRGTVTGLPVTNKLARVTSTPTPKFVISTPQVSPVAGPTRSPVSLSFLSGDRSRLSLQIYTQSGALVRTLAADKAYLAGPANVTWDGKRSDGTWSAAGAYVFRIVSKSSIDGKVSTVSRQFTIR